MKKLPRSFFERGAVSLARDLLGKFVILGDKVGRIVETEAYHEGDPASHSFSGKGFRNAVMFGKSGVAYVYFTYGMHHCFNVVCGGDGKGEAVLIRAVEPIKGVEKMRENRGFSRGVGIGGMGVSEKELRNLCNGPAKFCQAFGIDRSCNGMSLVDGKGIYFVEGDCDFEIVEATRVGISKGVDLPYRFYVRGCGFVSRG